LFCCSHKQVHEVYNISGQTAIRPPNCSPDTWRYWWASVACIIPRHTVLLLQLMDRPGTVISHYLWLQYHNIIMATNISIINIWASRFNAISVSLHYRTYWTFVSRHIVFICQVRKIAETVQKIIKNKLAKEKCGGGVVVVKK